MSLPRPGIVGARRSNARAVAPIPPAGGVSLNDSFSPVADRPRVFSGIQPTGDVHLGNLLGAVQAWVAEQDRYDAYYCVVDLHAMTVPFDPRELRRQAVSGAALLLACGIDPERSVVFVQSHVPAHSELSWILTCIARLGELRRMTQFKERSQVEGESVGAGLLTYPVLMAADVLLYQARGVPVGEDQKQHVELMRDLAERFNRLFGPTFTLPEPWIRTVGARIMALDDPRQKMSKSAPRPASKILLLDPPDAVAKKIRSAVTDSGTEIRSGADKPAISNLLSMFSAVEGTPVLELEQRFATSGYGELKSALAAAVIALLEPIQKRYRELMDDPTEVERVLAAGAARAAAEAEKTMARVRDATGLGVRPPA